MEIFSYKLQNSYNPKYINVNTYINIKKVNNKVIRNYTYSQTNKFIDETGN